MKERKNEKGKKIRRKKKKEKKREKGRGRDRTRAAPAPPVPGASRGGCGAAGRRHPHPRPHLPSRPVPSRPIPSPPPGRCRRPPAGGAAGSAGSLPAASAGARPLSRRGASRPRHGLHVRGVLLHAGAAAHRRPHLLRHLAHHRVRRAEDGLQEPHRPVQHAQPPCTSRVPHPCILLCYVSLCSRVAHTGSQYAFVGLSYLEVHEQARDERPRSVRPYDHHECRHLSLLPERGMVQISILPSIFFLLLIWHDLCSGELLRRHSASFVPFKCMQKP